MQQNHRKDFYEALEKIKTLNSFAISRYADGEASVLKNLTVGNKDGWLYKKDLSQSGDREKDRLQAGPRNQTREKERGEEGVGARRCQEERPDRLE